MNDDTPAFISDPLDEPSPATPDPIRIWRNPKADVRRRRRPTLKQLRLVADVAQHNFLESETLAGLGIETAKGQDQARRAFVAFTDWLSAQKEKASL